MQGGLDPKLGGAPVAGGESVVDLPVGHIGVGAPSLTEDLGVEVRVVGNVAGLAAEHGDLGVGEQIGRQAAVDGGGDRPDAFADDDDLDGFGVVPGEVAERGGAVDEALVVDRQRWRVFPGDVAEVRVAGA